MPPRKSMGRPAGATPARSTRASSAVSVLSTDTPVTRRSTRQATLQAASQSSEGSRARTGGQSIRQGSHLPDVHGQQSYAYGATKGFAIPAKLATAGRRTIRAMAEDIEEQVEEEVEPEEEEEAKELDPSSDAEASHVSDLSEIPEDSDQEDDQSSEISEPTPFPSSLADHSYNYERGIRRIRTVNVQVHPPQLFSPVKKTFQSTKSFASRVTTSIFENVRLLGEKLEYGALALRKTTSEFCSMAIRYLQKLRISSLLKILGVLLATALAMGMLGATVCFFYERIGCARIPASGWGTHIHTGFRGICGDCASPPTTFDFTNTSSQDLNKLSATLANINKKIQDLERRLTYRMDSNQATLESDLTSLKQQQIALSNHLADHVDQAGGNNGNVASPLFPKINFFSPSNGVTVDVYRTSPTKETQPPFLIKYLRNYFFYNYHDVNPPFEALKPWQDIGDCWCAANLAKTGPGQDFIRLSVDTKEMLYPTELVIEHFPSAGNLDRAATPRNIELWADFSHFDDDEWRQLKLEEMQQSNVLGPNYVRLGKMKYDASSGASHIQTGALDVNQFGLLHYAQRFVLRVTSNYGGKNACLYRVRLHGQPVAAPEAGNTEEWYERQGYQAEQD